MDCLMCIVKEGYAKKKN